MRKKPTAAPPATQQVVHPHEGTTSGSDRIGRTTAFARPLTAPARVTYLRFRFPQARCESRQGLATKQRLARPSPPGQVRVRVFSQPLTQLRSEALIGRHCTITGDFLGVATLDAPCRERLGSAEGALPTHPGNL
jgi:hypothetical protein